MDQALELLKPAQIDVRALAIPEPVVKPKGFLDKYLSNTTVDTILAGIYQKAEKGILDFTGSLAYLKLLKPERIKRFTIDPRLIRICQEEMADLYSAYSQNVIVISMNDLYFLTQTKILFPEEWQKQKKVVLRLLPHLMAQIKSEAQKANWYNYSMRSIVESILFPELVEPTRNDKTYLSLKHELDTYKRISTPYYSDAAVATRLAFPHRFSEFAPDEEGWKALQHPFEIGVYNLAPLKEQEYLRHLVYLKMLAAQTITIDNSGIHITDPPQLLKSASHSHLPTMRRF